MILYLSGAFIYCAFLLLSKFQDQECSKTDPISWLVIAIASIFWIVVIPISLIELKTKAKKQAKLFRKQKYKRNEVVPQYIETTI